MPKHIKAAVRKPRPDFPLFPHASGRWAKKIHGKFRYFGPMAADSLGEAALQRWLDEKDDLLARREPRRGGGVTIKYLCDAFLTAKEALVDAGEISRSHFFDYKAGCLRVADTFGRQTPVDTLRPDDFEKLRQDIATTYGPVSLGNEVQRIRSVFKWGIDTELLEKAVRFGPNFRKPSKKVRRLARKKSGQRLLGVGEMRRLIDKADVQLRAMILLGINCGLGQHDLATLPLSRLDLHRGWHSYERPKTGIDRRAALWPETVKALKEAIEERRKPIADEDSDLTFITKYGRRWVRCNDNGVWIDGIGGEFRKLARSLDMKHAGATFYSLRRTFRTIADEAGDQPATVFIMGHADEDTDMSATYRQRIDDSRLRKVSNYVRNWLFPRKRKAK